MNTFTLGACFQHKLHTGPYFMTFAPRLKHASRCPRPLVPVPLLYTAENLRIIMASEVVEYSDARISNTRAVKNLCLVYLSNTPPNLSLMLV